MSSAPFMSFAPLPAAARELYRREQEERLVAEQAAKRLKEEAGVKAGTHIKNGDRIVPVDFQFSTPLAAKICGIAGGVLLGVALLANPIGLISLSVTVGIALAATGGTLGLAAIAIDFFALKEARREFEAGRPWRIEDDQEGVTQLESLKQEIADLKRERNEYEEYLKNFCNEDRGTHTWDNLVDRTNPESISSFLDSVKASAQLCTKLIEERVRELGSVTRELIIRERFQEEELRQEAPPSEPSSSDGYEGI